MSEWTSEALGLRGWYHLFGMRAVSFSCTSPLEMAVKHMASRASNRQKKLLKFFDVPDPDNLSMDEARRAIGRIMSTPGNEDSWERYIYLTQDFAGDTDELKPFSLEDLEKVEIPPGWTSQKAIAEFKEDAARREIQEEGSPYDDPQPEIQFEGRIFMFTGKFEYGSRKDCQVAVMERGGIAPKKASVSSGVDYLIVGSEGSKAWKGGNFGTKIASAIASRKESGSPAIISEEHFRESLG